MSILKANVNKLLNQIEHPCADSTLASLEVLVIDAKYDICTQDAAWFAVGMVIAIAEKFPMLEGKRELISAREYGRAFVAAYRSKTKMTSLHQYIQEAMGDGTLPANALEELQRSRVVGTATLIMNLNVETK